MQEWFTEWRLEANQPIRRPHTLSEYSTCNWTDLCSMVRNIVCFELETHCVWIPNVIVIVPFYPGPLSVVCFIVVVSWSLPDVEWLRLAPLCHTPCTTTTTIIIIIIMVQDVSWFEARMYIKHWSEESWKLENFYPDQGPRQWRWKNINHMIHPK